MDFAKLNPWNWFKKEDAQDKALPTQPENPSESRQTPVGALDDLHAEIDRVFDNAFSRFGFGRLAPLPSLRDSGSTTSFKPRVDIAGSEKEYVISAELPGVDEKDIHVELRGDSLILSAEKRQEAKSEGKGFYRIERSYGSFQRVLAVPDDADTDAVKASYKKGVLTVTLPRKASIAPVSRRIAIE